MFFSGHWLLSHITIVDTIDSGERGMNPVAMTIINRRKEYWPSRGSNQRPPILKSATLPTELGCSNTNNNSRHDSFLNRNISLFYILQFLRSFDNALRKEKSYDQPLSQLGFARLEALLYTV